jgi:hypothetical protein
MGLRHEKERDLDGDTIFSVNVRLDHQIMHIDTHFYSIFSLLAETNGVWSSTRVILFLLTYILNKTLYINSVMKRLFLINIHNDDVKNLDKEKE